jgi:hypothetical protein
MKKIFSLILIAVMLCGNAYAACGVAGTGAALVPYPAKAKLLAGTLATTDKYRLAIDTSTSAYGTASTTYATTNQVSTADQYPAGGYWLTSDGTSGGTSTMTTGTDAATGTAWIDFTADISSASTTFGGGECIVIYNSSTNDIIYAVAVSRALAPSEGVLGIQFPAANKDNAIIRVARKILDLVAPDAYAADGDATFTLPSVTLTDGTGKTVVFGGGPQ